MQLKLYNTEKELKEKSVKDLNDETNATFMQDSCEMDMTKIMISLAKGRGLNDNLKVPSEVFALEKNQG